jgi:hypothetical protein
MSHRTSPQPQLATCLRGGTCWVWKPKADVSIPYPHGEHYDSYILRSYKSVFLHPEEEIPGLIDLPQG